MEVGSNGRASSHTHIRCISTAEKWGARGHPYSPLFLSLCKKQKMHLSHHVVCVYRGTLRPRAPHFIVNLDLTLKHFETGVSDKNSQPDCDGDIYEASNPCFVPIIVSIILVPPLMDSKCHGLHVASHLMQSTLFIQQGVALARGAVSRVLLARSCQLQVRH